MEAVDSTQEKSTPRSEYQRNSRAAAKPTDREETPRRRLQMPIDSGDSRQAAMEVTVENNIEKAMKVLKRKLIKEGLFRELKTRRYYEKPCERKKRKRKESIKKIRKEEARQKKNPYF